MIFLPAEYLLYGMEMKLSHDFRYAVKGVQTKNSYLFFNNIFYRGDYHIQKNENQLILETQYNDTLNIDKNQIEIRSFCFSNNGFVFGKKYFSIGKNYRITSFDFFRRYADRGIIFDNETMGAGFERNGLKSFSCFLGTNHSQNHIVLIQNRFCYDKKNLLLLAAAEYRNKKYGFRAFHFGGEGDILLGKNRFCFLAASRFYEKGDNELRDWDFEYTFIFSSDFPLFMDIFFHGDFFVEKNMNKDKEEFELRCLGGFVKKINSLQSGFYLEPVFYEINRYEYEEFIFHIVFCICV